MKRIIYLLLLFPFICFGQVPQGVNYQAVAYDANGFELSNKEVGVRISIVEGSAFGMPQLVEEHDVTTTDQGLFSIIIGQGAILGGEVASLLDIPWGSNTYFLKIELDIENNGSYMDFGTQQFMSVPYALYADSSGTPGPEGPEGPQGEPADPVDYDSLVNELILDSAFIADFSGGSGCNYSYPFGLNGIHITSEASQTNPYIVPEGKNLYVLNLHGGGDPTIDGIKLNTPQHSLPILLSSNQALYPNGNGVNHFTGLLVESIDNIDILTNSVNSIDNYIVPEGKKLFLTNWLSNGGGLMVGEIQIYSPNGFPVVLNSGESLSSNISDQYSNFNGYLVDEDYFENCGGGNNTLSSSIDYNALAEALVKDSVFLSNLSGGNSMGNDLLFPEGIDGESITFYTNSSSNPYVVPDGKRLYVLSGQNLMLNDGSSSLYVDITEGKPGIFNEGDEIWMDNPNMPYYNGILVDASPHITAISINSSPSNQYQVPSGKRLYVMSGGNMMLNTVEVDVTSWKPAVFNSGALVYTTQSGDAFNGYLVDEDYFEAPKAYIPDALQSTDEMFAAVQEQINTLDSLTALFEYKFELMNRPLQESLDLGVPLEDFYTVGYEKEDLYGLFYEGGIIFHIDDSGEHGLVSAVEDIQSSVWGCSGSAMGVWDQSIGSGYQNTLSILDGCSDRPIAASLASEYEVGEYADWYLPSLEELRAMSGILRHQVSANLIWTKYWSSSEGSTVHARTFDINPEISIESNKHNTHHIRPVRSF